MSTRSAKQRSKVAQMWLWSVLCAMLCVVGANGAHAINTPELKIEVKESPQPIVVGETATAKFSAYFVDKATQKEIYPPGVTISWTCPWTQLGSGAQNTNTTNVSFNSPSTAANDVTVMSASFGTVGDYSVRVRATASSNDWTPDTSTTAATTVTVSVKDVIVALDVGKDKTGYWADGTKDIFQTGNATIRPASKLNGLTVGLKTGTGYNNSNVTITEKSKANGKITFEWRGTAGSTIQVVNGKKVPDTITQIEARCNGVAKDSKEVVVVVPKSIKKPYPQLNNQEADVKNVGINSTTIPSTNLPPSWGYLLVTLYQRIIEVSVLDQFGESLDSIYNGASVTEDIGIGEVAINQQIQGGKYPDPIAVVRPGIAKYDIVNPGSSYPDDGKEVYENWLKGIPGFSPLPTNPPHEITMTVVVFVAGHQIDSSARTIKGIPPKSITLIW